MTWTEKSAEDTTCLVLLQQIAATADATAKLEPPEAATALRTLAGAYKVLADPPFSLGDTPLDAQNLPHTQP
ncbi:hypothetical protein NC658_03010 [Streptomyces griseoincarnatus]|uniref:Uncharacterized protein n=1 Tax=Streptomyces griseoincarnatus TaxID=29305 RepID=A0ABT0VQL6_STRGI|nr:MULTISPECIES: hypothetical protein [Streptomyces]MBJ6612921.1 hypothetical protein [Streptomyces sp. I3(2020)]MBJ6624185.1 hypothetical protein [Streptomyces sp. I4(2020)]MCM2512228.1 hypothetical protein [Streptomyces griseoincarnatus]